MKEILVAMAGLAGQQDPPLCVHANGNKRGQQTKQDAAPQELTQHSINCQRLTPAKLDL